VPIDICWKKPRSAFVTGEVIAHPFLKHKLQIALDGRAKIQIGTPVKIISQ
jgi:hypothetical protein